MKPTRLERHARWVIRHRLAIVLSWIVLFVVAGFLAGRIGDVTTSQVNLPGTEAQRGFDVIKTNFAGGDYSTLQPVFRSRTETVDDPAYRAGVTAALARAAQVVPGTQVVSYYTTGSPDLVSADRHTTFATLRLPIDPTDAKEKVEPIRSALDSPAGLEKPLVGGQAASDHDLSPIFDNDLRKAELFSFPLALLILLLVFGTLTAALLPFAVAVMTIVCALGVTYLVGLTGDLAVYVTNVITLIGLGIGIDYSLLIVSRFREELALGKDRDEALVRTIATAGHAVIFSGVTVAIGLAVLVFMPVPFIRSMGIGGMLVPIFAVFAALTLLPALMHMLGRRINSLPVIPRRWVNRAPGKAWGKLAHGIMKHALPVFAAAAIVMIALAIPSRSLSVNQDALADAPSKAEAVQAARVIQGVAEGAANPDTLVIDTGRPGGVYASAGTLTAFANQLRTQTDTVRGVTWPQATPSQAVLRRAGLEDPTGRYALMDVAPLSDALSPQARQLNNLLDQRKVELEQQLGSGSQVLLTGEPAFSNDFNHSVYGPFPWLVLLVLVLSYLVLLRAFRSVVLPLKAVVLNLISLLATYGILVLVFQEGLGVRGIASWIPVFLFAFLFGLSMDYEVFLVSRMREIYDEGATNEEAVAGGLQSTGRIVTSAALVMVVAFSGFTLGSSIDLKVFGLGLAAAIAIDATIVRALLVPALMKVMGRWNWYLPPRIARIARVRPSPLAPESG